MRQRPYAKYQESEDLILIDDAPSSSFRAVTMDEVTRQQEAAMREANKVRARDGLRCSCSASRFFAGDSRDVRRCDACQDPQRSFKKSLIRSATLVYFITSPSGHVKIGTSSSVVKRLTSIQVSHPEKLSVAAVLTGGTKLEFKLHMAFSRLRTHGEWFRRADLIVDFAVNEMGAAKVVA